MLNNFISSVIAFLLTLVPVFSVLPSNQLTSNQVTIIFTGDIMLGRSVMGASLDSNDSYYPFRKTADFLKSADITFGNLETPIIKNCPRHVGGLKFCTTPEIAKGLNFAGIDIVSLANNHTSNYGKEGMEETKKYLKENDIKYVGDNNLEIIERNNIKFGFLGFDYVTSQKNIEADLNLIKESDPKADVLIVSPHWGIEYKDVASSMQQVVSKKMVDNGADLIIGHHPHWVQNSELIKKPVYDEVASLPSDSKDNAYQGYAIAYYSLGNFVFDQMWSEETKKGLVVKIAFDGKEIVEKEEFKTYIPKIGQPVLQDGV